MVPIIHWWKGPNRTKSKQACYSCLAKQPNKPICSCQWKWHSLYSTSIVEWKTIAPNFKYRFTVISYNTITHKSIFCPLLYYCLQMQLTAYKSKILLSLINPKNRRIALGRWTQGFSHPQSSTYLPDNQQKPRGNLQGRKQKGPSSIPSLPHVTTYNLTKWKWSTQAYKGQESPLASSCSSS